MNTNIEKLYQLSLKQERIILGLMSGTSCDGLDVALCKISGSGTNTKLTILQFETIEYADDFKKEIKTSLSRKDADLENICLLNPYIATQHAKIANQCLKKWNFKKEDIDLIASHGQTIYHAPKSLHEKEKFPNATLQIGDGDHIAVQTGIITISDFRQKHIAAGGEGAPLAVYGDYLLFSKLGENRILLNIGGIANFTFLPGDGNTENIFSSDVGPGNTMMDAFIRKHFSEKKYDDNGNIAKQGTFNNELLLELKSHAFFENDFPKTTGPELFNLNYLQKAQEKTGTESLSKEDVMATLNKFTTDTIVLAINKIELTMNPTSIYVSGGGFHNAYLLENIKSQLTHTFDSTNSLHINEDAKEAVLFAVLANECVCGSTLKIGLGKNKIPSITMGKISFPD
ncbi:MAG: anhydro-N-acetylmuramic acid kinase [Chitinophagaceae bacterium]|nr:MAG: anhydro-N-acetylmuramic acid kinase [Chitinophagaceae bacterium]